MNYGRFIGQIAGRRQPSIIRELLKILSTASPDMIPLSGGLPNPAMFPFREAQFTLKDGTTIDLAGGAMNAALQYLPTQVRAGIEGRLPIGEWGRGCLLTNVLYSNSLPLRQGHGPLVERLQQLQVDVHGVNQADFDNGT